MQQSRQQPGTRNSNSTNGSDETNQFGDDLWETPDDDRTDSSSGLQQRQQLQQQLQQELQQQLQQRRASSMQEQQQQQSMPSPSTSASSVINSLQGLMMDSASNININMGGVYSSNVGNVGNSNSSSNISSGWQPPFVGTSTTGTGTSTTSMEQQQQQQQLHHSARTNMNVAATSNRTNDAALQSFPPSLGRSGMQLFHHHGQRIQQQQQQQQLASASQFQQQFATVQQQQQQQLHNTNDLLLRRQSGAGSSTFPPASATGISFGTVSDPFEPSSIGTASSSHPGQSSSSSLPSVNRIQGNPFADATNASGMTNVAVQQGMSHGRISPSRRFTWAAGSRSEDAGGASSVATANLLKAFMNSPPNNDERTVNSVANATITADSCTNHNAMVVNRQRDLPSRPSSAPIDATKQKNASNPVSTPPFDPNMPFPVKLHHILSQEAFSESVTWLSHGRAWRVMKPQLFEKQVMARFFRSAKYASFMRQVNGWGFRRILTGPDINAYYHELFLRGLPNLCVKMKRLPRGQEALSRAARDVPSDGGAPDFYRMHKLSPLPTVQKGNNKRRSSSSSRGSAPASAMPFTMKRAESVAQQNNGWLESILAQTQHDVPVATAQLQALLSEDGGNVAAGSSLHQLSSSPAPLSLANQAYLVSQNRVLLEHVTRMQEQLDEMDTAAQSTVAETKGRTSTRQSRSP